MTATDTAKAAREAEIVERYRADLAAGVIFDRHAASAASYIGYRPVTSRNDFAAMITRLGRFAGLSDEAAQLAVAVLRTVQLYGCKEDMIARAYTAAAEAVREGYTDVVALAGPQPPKRSHAERPYSLATLLNLLGAIGGGRTGWVAARLRTELGMPAENPYAE